MTRAYRIRKIDSTEYGYLIFASSFISPLEQRLNIERDLAKRGYSGLVIFDFLLSSGNTHTRFQEIYFDGNVLSLRSARSVLLLEGIKRVVDEFYHKNFEMLDASILSKPKQFKLRKGLSI